jgi:multiple sugar transport system permease protein
MMKKLKQFREHMRIHGPSYRAKILGSGDRKGLLYYIIVYFLSITFAFVFMYPVFYMFMISLMSNTDLVDSTILWIPSSVYWKNYLFAVRGLTLNESYYETVIIMFTNRAELVAPFAVELRKFLIIISAPIVVTLVGGIYFENRAKLFSVSSIVVLVILLLPKSYVDSVYVSGTVTLVTVISSALVGYGLARFQFKGKGFIVAMMLLIYILPKTLLFIPRSILYGELGIKGTMFALWGPSFLGQGVQATFFILIFFQFFRMIPNQIEESAYLDGATSFNIFVKIAVPMAVPAFVISMTYGFAVNWNELFLTNVYLSGNIKTIPMLLQGLQAAWGNVADYSSGSDIVNVDFTEAKSFAGTILSIIPLVIMYGIIQRYFIESIDKSGIAGE